MARYCQGFLSAEELMKHSPDIFKTVQKDLHGETKEDLPELLAFCDSQYLRSEKWAPNKNNCLRDVM